jgi:hypothetical protein
MFEEETITEMWGRAQGLLLKALESHPSFSTLKEFFTLDQFLLHLGIKTLGVS